MKKGNWSIETKKEALDILYQCEAKLSELLGVHREEARSLMKHHVDPDGCSYWKDWFERPLYLEPEEDGYLEDFWMPHKRNETLGGEKRNENAK